MTKQLTSFLQLAEEMAKNTVRAAVVVEAGLEAAANLVQKDAQGRLGEYQDAIGDYPAWVELADSTKADRARQGYAENDPLLRDGTLRDSIVTEHTVMQAVIGSKNPIAAYQEFGTETIPPRPFLAPAAEANKKKIHQMIGLAVAGALGGNPLMSITTLSKLEE